jgi:hypothetical protein
MLKSKHYIQWYSLRYCIQTFYLSSLDCMPLSGYVLLPPSSITITTTSNNNLQQYFSFPQ